MSDAPIRRPTSIDPRGYELVGVPANPDPETAAAVRRLLAQYRESTPDRLARLSDDQIRDAFISEGLTDRHIAREVLIDRNIRALYSLGQLPPSASAEDLVRAGDMEEAEWAFCFLIQAAAIDDYLRAAYGDAYGS